MAVIKTFGQVYQLMWNNMCYHFKWEILDMIGMQFACWNVQDEQ